MVVRECSGDGRLGTLPDSARLPSRGSIETLIQNRKPARVLSAVLPGGLIQIGVPMARVPMALDTSLGKAKLREGATPDMVRALSELLAMRTASLLSDHDPCSTAVARSPLATG